MQQLFPRPGETVPRLRFPEFRDAGEWRFQPLLDDVCRADSSTKELGSTKCVPIEHHDRARFGLRDGAGVRNLAALSLDDSYKNYIRLQRTTCSCLRTRVRRSGQFPQGYIARYCRHEGKLLVPNSIFTCFKLDTAAVIRDECTSTFSSKGIITADDQPALGTSRSVQRAPTLALSVSDDDLMSMPVPLPPAEVIESRAAAHRRLPRLAGRSDRGAGPEARNPAAAQTGADAAALPVSGAYCVVSNTPKVRKYRNLNKLAARLRSDVTDIHCVLLYAYNRTGKTRLSMEFKDIGKRKSKGTSDTLCFNAFTEDLFV